MIRESKVLDAAVDEIAVSGRLLIKLVSFFRKLLSYFVPSLNPEKQITYFAFASLNFLVDAGVVFGTVECFKTDVATLVASFFTLFVGVLDSGFV